MTSAPAPPFPLIEASIDPKTEADWEKLKAPLAKLQADDPKFGVSIDRESGLSVLCGASEVHLDRKISELRSMSGADFKIGAPQVAYRETLGRSADIDYTHKKLTGGTGQFARIIVKFEPGEPGSGYVFEASIPGDNVPEKYVPAVARGLEQAKENGLLAGFPVIDFKATLIDGAYHDLDSSEVAFEIAAMAAFRELRDKAKPMLLEPVMKIEVVTPEDYVGDVIVDLNTRRGQIQGTDQRGDDQVIFAFAPLSNLFGYVSTLRGMTQGRAEFTMAFDHYERVPQQTPPDDLYPSDIGMRA